MLKIAIIGSECTGKTTISKLLAKSYNAVWVQEYSRDYALEHPSLSFDTVLPIIEGQIALEDSAEINAKKHDKTMVIYDTTPLSSIVYSDFYYNRIPANSDIYAQREYDLYLLTYIDVLWQADGIRDSFARRNEAHNLFEGYLTRYNQPYVTLKGSLDARLELAKKHIDKIVQSNKK